MNNNNELRPYRGTTDVPSNAIRISDDARDKNAATVFTTVNIGKEFTLQDLVAVLNKNKWIILSCVFASFMATFVYCQCVPTLYTAVATLEIRGYAPVLGTTSMESLFTLDSRKEMYQRTTIARLGRMSVADQVLANDHSLLVDVSKSLNERKNFDWGKLAVLLGLRSANSSASDGNQAPNPNPKLFSTDSSYNITSGLLNAYLGLLDVMPVPNTSLVEVSATTPDPILSQRIANAHSLGFIDLLRKERQENVLSNLQILKQQEEELRAKVSASERALADYAEKNKVLTGAENQGSELAVKQIGLLTDRLSNATSSRVQLEVTMNSILKSGGPGLSSYLDNQSIKDLLVNLKETEAKYADQSVQFTDEYPAMQQLKARIDSLRWDVRKQRELAFAGLKMQIESAKSLEASLSNQIEQQKKLANELSQKLVEYNILSRENSSLRDLYQNVLRQLKETQVGSVNNESNIIITDMAAVPTAPSKPLKGLLIAMGTGVGFAIGLLLVFFKEVLNKRVETEDDVKAVVGLPSLGVLPAFNQFEEGRFGNYTLLDGRMIQDNTMSTQLEKQSSAGSQEKGTWINQLVYGLPRLISRKRIKADEWSGEDRGYAKVVGKSAVNATDDMFDNLSGSFVTISAPLGVVSESLRLIRTNLVLSSASDASPKVIMITSSNQGEGKTTIASNLAVSLAQASRRTLLLDCDMRQSRISELFGLHDALPGLVDYLAGQAQPADILHITSVSNLHVIRSGSSSPNPAELLGSQKMADLMVLLAKEYDYVIVDSPPVMPVADSLILSKHVSAVVVVARSGVTQKSALREAISRLHTVGAKILGTVVNDVVKEFSDYKAYGLSVSAKHPKRVKALKKTPKKMRDKPSAMDFQL